MSLHIRVDGVPGGRMYLDEDEFLGGRVRAPDGTTEQCGWCGEDLGHAIPRGVHFDREVKCQCGTVYEVREDDR